MSKTYQALLVEENNPGQFTRRVVERPLESLPEGEVLLRVEYSSLNYKDALSAIGNRGVTRVFPHVPGIDAAGVVEESRSPEFKPGERVLVVAEDMGVNRPGGFAQFVPVLPAWLTRIPQGLSTREAMAYGTAGYTAALCVERLKRAGLTPDMGDILVTGATGGVGSIAIGILALEGFRVVAATGKMSSAGMLRSLGASDLIQRSEIDDSSGRPLLSGRWAGAVDTVGGNFLSSTIRACKPNGVITCCGNAASPDLPLTVFPFILRGVSLLGVDALHTLRSERDLVWQKLANEWKLSQLGSLVREVTLRDLDEEIQKILRGDQAGRVVVKLS